MKIETKDAAIKATGGDDAFPGTFQVILSAPTKDRDGDTLLPDEWKQPLPSRINFDMDHGMSVATTVGSGVPSINSMGQLVVDGSFSSLARAQECRTLVKEGHIDRTSVTFMSEPSTTKDGKPQKLRELLSGAFVAIPSNREAVVLASKTFNVIPKAGARNAASDMQHIQAIHDSAVALGAKPAQPDPSEESNNDDQAAAKSAAELAARKSIVGSVEAGQDRIADALNDTYADRWPWSRGTLPAGPDGGTVVFDLMDPTSGERQTFRQEYTDDGSLVTLVGDPEPVDLMEIVVADADADEDPELQIYTAAAAEARSLLQGVDLTTLPEPVRKALGLLVPTSTADGVTAPSTAELAPIAVKAFGATDAATHADEATEMQDWVLKFRTYNNFASRKA